MCGIFGYVNWRVSRSTREILNTLLEGLQRVEYRGYDSAGLCMESHDASHRSVLVRSVGNIAQLRECVFSETRAASLGLDKVFETHAGIAHTRWATHGPPVERNCHPQSSNSGDFLIVHNGIMTNFMALRQTLAGNGYRFDSDTDTEVIAVLAEELYAQQPSLSLVQLAAKISRMAEGAYAILIKSSHHPGEIVACRKSSPLALGVRRSSGDKDNAPGAPCEVFFGSDVNSFATHTRNVIFMEDGDIAHFGNGALSLFTIANGDAVEKVERPWQQVDLSPESLCKGSFDHFMLKEIHEQVESVARSMHARLNFESGLVQIDSINADAVAALRGARRLMLIACGTSFHSCLAARPIFEELLPGVPIMVENAPDFVDRHPSVTAEDACVFVSQSGETADTLAALQICRAGNAILVGVTNVAGSSVQRLTRFAVSLCAGVEVGVASTKAYTSQIVVLTLLAMLLSQSENGPNAARLAERRAAIAAGLAALPVALAQCLKMVQEDITKLTKLWLDIPTLLILGRGYDYATALESALKVKEVSYIYTEGIHSGELKHGPLALVDKNTALIAFCANDKHFEMSKSAIQQIGARGGRIVVVTTKENDAEVQGIAASCLHVPATVDCLQPIINVVPMQLLSYYLALARGHNVDCPRNLAKSVTVQ